MRYGRILCGEGLGSGHRARDAELCGYVGALFELTLGTSEGKEGVFKVCCGDTNHDWDGSLSVEIGAVNQRSTLKK